MIDLAATRAQAVIDDDVITIALCDRALRRRPDAALIARIDACRALYDMSQDDALAELYADVMTEDDIRAWWRHGGALDDSRDLITARGEACTRYGFRRPYDDEVRAARVRIASAIIADHRRAHERIAAGIARLADDDDLRRRIRRRYVQIAFMVGALFGMVGVAILAFLVSR